MNTPVGNKIILIVFNIAAICIFILTFFFPSFRQIAYAPLREWIIPPPQPVEIDLVYSTEKEAWLTEALHHFNDADFRYEGRPIEVRATSAGSRDMYLDVLNGTSQPAIISPASTLQIKILADLSSSKFGQAVVHPNDPELCRSAFTSPLVLVAWKDRAKVLWGSDPEEDLWKKIGDAAIDSAGWQPLGHPEWGYFKFSHTNPLKSNSGFMTILLMSYDFLGTDQPITEDQILNDSAYQTWFLGVENSISQFGESTGTYMKDIVAYGPSMYDAVTVYEATAIEYADQAVGRYGELKVYYPPRTILSDHPFCVLQADWVTEEQQGAAKLVLDYLTGSDLQRLALLRYGFRPVDASIELDQAGSPFTRYQANGLKTALPPEVALPSGNALNTLLDFWSRNIEH